MSTVKKYKLLKDINSFELTAKSGDVGIQAESERYEDNCKGWFDNGRYFFYLSTILEHSPEWFSPVIEEQEPVSFNYDLSFLASRFSKELFIEFIISFKERLVKAHNFEAAAFIRDEVEKKLHEEQPTTSIDKVEEKQPLFITEDVIGCGICGGKLVKIRGRYPGDSEREVCPTCAVERLEMINEISDKDYRKTYTSIN